MLGQRNGLPRTISGFINRPYQDTPGSTDISMWCGHIDVEKNLKQIGLEYTELINTADRSEYPKAEYTTSVSVEAFGIEKLEPGEYRLIIPYNVKTTEVVYTNAYAYFTVSE